MVWIKDAYEMVLVNLDLIQSIQISEDNFYVEAVGTNPENIIVLYEGSEKGDANDYLNSIAAELNARRTW